MADARADAEIEVDSSRTLLVDQGAVIERLKLSGCGVSQRQKFMGYGYDYADER